MTEDHDDVLQHGVHVEVRQRFDRRWVRGLVETVNDDGFEVRREHDGVLLPERFHAEDVRIEKRRFHLWPRRHH